MEEICLCIYYILCMCVRLHILQIHVFCSHKSFLMHTHTDKCTCALYSSDTCVLLTQIIVMHTHTDKCTCALYSSNTCVWLTQIIVMHTHTGKCMCALHILPTRVFSSYRSSIILFFPFTRSRRNGQHTHTHTYTHTFMYTYNIHTMHTKTGEMGNFAAYGFAPATLVAPLGAVSVVANAMYATLMLAEQFRHRDLFGTLLVIVGGAGLGMCMYACICVCELLERSRFVRTLLVIVVRAGRGIMCVCMYACMCFYAHVYMCIYVYRDLVYMCICIYGSNNTHFYPRPHCIRIHSRTV